MVNQLNGKRNNEQYTYNDQESVGGECTGIHRDLCF